MFFLQLRLLLWKNFILRKRHWLRTIIEILWPVFLFAILVGIRKSQFVETVPECHYPARAMPSAGVFPWIKSLLCDLQNPCFQTELPSEIPGQVNNPVNANTSSIDTQTIFQILALLSSNSTTSELNQSANDLQALTNLTNNITSNTNISNADIINAILTGNSSALPSLDQDSLFQLFNATQSLQVPSGLQQTLPLLQSLDLTSLTSAFSGLNSTSFSDFCGHPQQIQNSSDVSNLLGGAIASSGLNISSGNFCSEFINYFENNNQFRFFWDTAKPLLLGKVAYSPDTELTRAIIARANATFASLGFLQNVGETWQTTIGPGLYQTLESGATVQALRTALENDVTLNLLASQLNVPVASLQQLRDFLSNDDNPNDQVTTWKDLFRQINGIFLAVTRVLQCIELDKFVGFNTESELVDYSLQKVENRTLWGGVVFTTISSLHTELPNIVSYKIRQDAGYVTRTTTTQRFFWRPGAEDGIEQVRYYVNGFVHIQDMIENSIVRLALNESGVSNEFDMFLGKYLQEFPYPCYTRDSYWEPDASAGATSNEMAYYYNGFLFIQDIFDRAIISMFRNSTSDPDNEPFVDPRSFLGVHLQEFPYPCYTEDEFLEYLAVMLSLLLTLAWIYSVCVIIKNIVYEKEQRLKEVMKMMGLSNGVHWVAWFIDSLAVMFCSIVLLLIILRTGDITPFSNMFIVFLWLFCYSIATITLCFLISCFFSRANLAAACGGIIFFLLYIPYNMVFTFDDEMTLATKIIACLLSNVAFGYGAAYISQYEMSGDGIQFFNWNSSPDPSDELTFLISLIMLLVDAFIYMTLTWYIENVFPGTYGVPKRWYFFVTRDYWCGASATTTSYDGVGDDVQYDESIKLEAEPRHLTLGVSLHHLRKVYGNGKVAVNDLSVNFYEGQITSFLGHNGAGKTTTMSMLTGLFTPTSGTATIYGSDIRHQIDLIRRQLGFCPQHNVLFGDLTVMEHLQFYSGLKKAVGSVSDEKDEIETMLNDVGLPHKRDEVSRHLSGGMKRKLSVAVAFVGGSKCVILDEPTAGVDPYARRGIWDLLLRYRSDRTIILSTHHMDEADLLGDRIAIISHGSLKCCGSSLFLKSTFGVGYYLTVVKKDTMKEGSDSTPPSLPKNDSGSLKEKASDEGFESNVSTAPSSSSLSTRNDENAVTYYSNDAARSAQITNLILRNIPGSKIHEENPREITFVLPYAAQSEGKFSDMFDKLDLQKLTYGMTDTSLEEIFLNVAEQSYDEGKEEKTKCCCCIPRRRKKSVAQEPIPLHEDLDDQARIGSRRRRNTESSINTDFFNIPPTTAHGARKTPASDPEADIIDGNLVEDGEGLSDGSMGKGSYQVTGRKLVWQQFRALLVKRFHHARRNKKGVIAQVIVPAGFIALALIFTLIIPQVRNYPPLELQPWMYGDTNVFYSNDMPSSNLSNSVSDSIFESPTLGMRCVDGYQVTNYDDELLTCNNFQNGEWGFSSDLRSLTQVTYSNTTLVCQCTDKDTRVLLAECPAGAGGAATPIRTMQSSDIMYDMTGRNISDWLVKTVDLYVQQRYGGLSLGETYHSPINSEQVNALLQFLAANSNLTFNTANNNTASALLEGIIRSENAKVWFDNNGYHSQPTWLNILNNAALRSTLPSGQDPRQHGIVVINHPLDFTQSTVDLAALSQSITDTLISISVIFALSFVPASFVLFLIDEKTSKAKHLQFVSGVNQAVYWVATYLWDMINYMVPTIIVLIIFLCFQTKAYVSADNFPCLLLLLVLYGFAITPMMYPASFYFEVPSTAYVVLTCINLFIGINTSIATFILELLDDPVLTEVNKYLVQVFLIFPQYCLGRGLIDMSLNQAYGDAYAAFGIDRFQDPFTFTLVGRNLMALAIEGVVFFLITLLIQYRFFIKPRRVEVCDLKHPYNEKEYDVDVVAEKNRLLSGASQDILQVKDLTKIYKKAGSKKNLIAVDRLCLGVPEGECFGLLGVNGAGKTTTFKMLTGDIVPTAGDASILQQSILGDLREVQQNTGYCPQFEALNALLTGREHLIFYAKLRGVPPEDMDRVADWGINNFGLKQYANKPAGTYSGGNKRKLSAAIAFIGCPPVVFLDEPTAGMDPMSRRFLWGRINEAVRGGRCIVLTSHSMEECEALCTRLAIMVNGKLQCIGSPQHLKNKYGEGYTITVKVGGLNPNFEAVQNFIVNAFPGAMLKESHCNTLMYQLPSEEAKLKDVFNEMEENKAKLDIEDYSISQTTLDEVFVSFAKNQTDGVVLEDQPMSGNKFSASNEIPGTDDGIVMQNLYNAYSNEASEPDV